MEIIQRNIADLIEAEYNPRELTKDQFKQLSDSLTRFGMVDPVIVNKHPEREDIIVGGHQRCKVWRELGNEVVPTVEVNLTPDKEKELNVRLNKNTGQFDMDMLANHFDTDELIEWGFEEGELVGFDDYSDKNQEIDVDEFSDEMVINLKYSEEDYMLVKEQLSKISSTPENAVWKLLGNE